MTKLFLFLIVFMTQLHASNDKITCYLEELISFKSITQNQQESARALEWVKTQLQDLGLKFFSHEFNGFRSLVITTQQTKTPKVLLVSHIDVVPCSEGLFCPEIKDQKMFARGAYDMKMAIACYIQLMHELKDSLGEYDIGIMLTSDEEIGGMNGVRALLAEGYGAEVALLPDGGFNWNFEEAAKGVLHLKITSQGTSAHGSRPWLGENAISKLMLTLQEIERYFEKSKTGDYFATVNIGTIQGGKKPKPSS